MHADSSLPPPSGGRECRLLMETWLQIPCRSTSGPCCVDFSKKYRWAGNALKKKLSIIQKTQEKDRTLGNFDFPFWDFFSLLVRLLICSQMPRNIMKMNRDAAAERTAGNLQRDLTESRSSISPLKTLCNETQMCDACVGSRPRAAAWLQLMLAPFCRICLQVRTSASF